MASSHYLNHRTHAWKVFPATASQRSRHRLSNKKFFMEVLRIPFTSSCGSLVSIIWESLFCTDSMILIFMRTIRILILLLHGNLFGKIGCTDSKRPLIRRPADMHHRTCVMHVSWCMPGSLTSSFLWSWWRGKCSWHSRRMRNPQFYVYGKRPIAISNFPGNIHEGWYQSVRWVWQNFTFWNYSHISQGPICSIIQLVSPHNIPWPWHSGPTGGGWTSWSSSLRFSWPFWCPGNESKCSGHTN